MLKADTAMVMMRASVQAGPASSLIILHSITRAREARNGGGGKRQGVVAVAAAAELGGRCSHQGAIRAHGLRAAPAGPCAHTFTASVVNRGQISGPAAAPSCDRSRRAPPASLPRRHESLFVPCRIQ